MFHMLLLAKQELDAILQVNYEKNHRKLFIVVHELAIVKLLSADESITSHALLLLQTH